MNRNVALLVAVLVSTCSNLAAQGSGEAGAGRVMVCTGVGVRPTPPPVLKNIGSWYSDLWVERSHPSYANYWDLSRDALTCVLQPVAIVPVPVPQTPAPASPPPAPPTPVVHEYSWPESNGDGGQAYAIISKSGTVQRAIAVWVQGGLLCFLTPDGISRQLPLDEVDRQSTTRINSELKHNLPLPIQDSHQEDSIKTSTGG